MPFVLPRIQPGLHARVGTLPFHSFVLTLGVAHNYATLESFGSDRSSLVLQKQLYAAWDLSLVTTNIEECHRNDPQGTFSITTSHQYVIG